MKIRNAEQKDVGALDALLTRLSRLEKQWDPNIDEEYLWHDNYAGMIGAEGFKVLVAEEDGELIGFLSGFVLEQPARLVRIAILDALYVSEDHRKKGCAKALIEAFRQFAVEESAGCIELKVLSGNLPAGTLYESLGFKEISRYMRLKL